MTAQLHASCAGFESTLRAGEVGESVRARDPPGRVPEADDVLLLFQVPDDAGAIGVAAGQDVLHLPIPRQAAHLRLRAAGARRRPLATEIDSFNPGLQVRSAGRVRLQIT